MSAVYLAVKGQAVTLGVTRQLVGRSWCRAAEFQYCGSVGPVAVVPELLAEFQRLGQCLAGEFRFRRVVWVNSSSTIARSGQSRLIRAYPASAEVLERALRVSLVGLHVAVCRDGLLPPALPTPRDVAGKAILFAQHDLDVDSRLVARLLNENCGLPDPLAPRVADIPVAGTKIRAGWPMFTLLTDGHSASEVEPELRRRAKAIES